MLITSLYYVNNIVHTTHYDLSNKNLLEFFIIRKL